MVQPSDILDAVERLTLENGRLPSLLAVSRATGLTKQGVLHHFPTRSALDRAVTLRAIEQVDTAMRSASADGSPVETYLRLSSPTDRDRAAALIITAALQDRGSLGLPAEMGLAVKRWERMLADELGDRLLAEIVRLTGDGLFGEALVTGSPPAPDRVDRLIGYFRSAISRS
jgi:AcrR family transcriptional regulator